MRRMGDNSGASIEELDDLRAEAFAEEIEPNKLFYFVKWNLADYIAGTQDLTIEQEGVYIRFLVRLYDRGKPFPDDDRFMVTVLGLSTVRVWKRVRDSLLEIGKIIRRNGCLTNNRFERERAKRAQELRRQANAARKRWAVERAKKTSSEKVSPKFGESLGEVCPNISPNFGEKPNEINDHSVTTHMPSKSPESKIDREEEKDSDPDGSGGEPPETSLRELVWTKCIAWLLPRSCLDEVRLRNRVGRWVQEFGAGAVIDAVAIAQKEGPVSIMAYVEGILRRSQRPKPVNARMSKSEFIAELDKLEGYSE